MFPLTVVRRRCGPGAAGDRRDRTGAFDPIDQGEAKLNRVAASLGSRWRRSARPEWLEGWEPRPFVLEGGTTETVQLGSGPALLLLPPLPGFKEAWVACAHGFARRFRVVTFDLRTRFAGPPGWGALLEDLERVSDALAPGPAVVVGHSLGAMLALRWALHRPERVSALVLSSGSARVPRPAALRDWPSWRRRYLEQPGVLALQRWLPERAALAVARRLAAREAWVYDAGCDEAVLGLACAGIRSVPVRAALAHVRLALRDDARDAARAIARPTLVVAGEREWPAARAAAEELARLIPGARLELSPGASHLHPLSNPEWLVERVGRWLDGPIETTGRR